MKFVGEAMFEEKSPPPFSFLIFLGARLYLNGSISNNNL